MCAATVKICTATFEHIFDNEDCAPVSENILCFLRNVRLLLKEINKICAAASEDISCVQANVWLLLGIFHISLKGKFGF